MSATPFTRRKFLISTAAAASSAWFLAACSGGEPDSPAAAPQSPQLVPQSEIDTAMDTATTLTFWTWVPDIQNEVKLFTTQVPKDQGQFDQRGAGRPALPEAADRHPVRAGCAGRRPGRVPVHQLLHAGRGKPAGPDPVRPGDAEGRLSGVGVVAGEHQWRPVGHSPRHRPDGSALSGGPPQRRRDRAAQDLGRLRRRGRDLPHARTRRATWCNVAPSQVGRDGGVPVAGRCAAVQLRRQADREGRPRERGGQEAWSSSGGIW